MEYVNGGDLMFHIQRCGKFKEPQGNVGDKKVSVTVVRRGIIPNRH